MTDEADRHRMRRYGLAPAEYALMVQQQPNCAICDRPWTEDNRPQVDHWHGGDGTITRDLLCRPCNLALGLLQEDPRRMYAMILYCRDHPSGGYVDD